MANINVRIKQELEKTKIPNIMGLIQVMEEQRFFLVGSSSHDHWKNGTAQHSWRVFQYMKYFKQHPDEIDSNRHAQRNQKEALLPENVKQLNDTDIVLCGLLHDLGKMQDGRDHEVTSRRILEATLGIEFEQKYPQVIGAIYFHHNRGKNGGRLNQYKNYTLTSLLREADCLASATTWNSTRQKEHRTQHTGVVCHGGHLRRVALDRTCQVLNYRVFLDCHYELHPIIGYGSRIIEWNTEEQLVQKIKKGDFENIASKKDSDYISDTHSNYLNGNNNRTIAVGIDMRIITENERKLRQYNLPELELLICSNILNAFYQKHSEDNHRFSFKMRDAIAVKYQEQSSNKGIMLKNVIFFRDGKREGYKMVSPWCANVLLVPGWHGACIID